MLFPDDHRLNIPPRTSDTSAFCHSAEGFGRVAQVLSLWLQLSAPEVLRCFIFAIPFRVGT